MPSCRSVAQIDDVVASYDRELRRRLRKWTEYRLRPVFDEAEMMKISSSMIERYAIARHGRDPLQIPAEAAGSARARRSADAHRTVRGERRARMGHSAQRHTASVPEMLLAYERRSALGTIGSFPV